MLIPYRTFREKIQASTASRWPVAKRALQTYVHSLILYVYRGGLLDSREVGSLLTAFGRKQPLMSDRFRAILLKKSTSNSTAEKYAPEIEI
jgi:hypothetical protein